MSTLSHVVITLPATGRGCRQLCRRSSAPSFLEPVSMPDAPSQATDGQATEALVAWDFHAREPDELSLRRGERDRIDR